MRRNHVEERQADCAAPSQKADVRSLDDAQLMQATLAHNQVAWPELMRRYSGPRREAARDASEGIADPDLDDLIGDLWRWLIEGDMRRIRPLIWVELGRDGTEHVRERRLLYLMGRRASVTWTGVSIERVAERRGTHVAPEAVQLPIRRRSETKKALILVN